MDIVAVVGAGPGGCSAAIALARQGVAVHLFERGQPGKDKPCGDALLPDAVQAIERLGVSSNHYNSESRPFNSIELWDAQRVIWSISTGDDPGWIAPRAIVDQLLRDAAGGLVEIRYGTPVRTVQRHGTRWSVSQDETTPAYDAVVLASGATNALSRQYGLDGAPVVGASVSCYATLQGVDAPLFQFGPLGLPGYGWVFPVSPTRVNIGVCSTQHRSGSLQHALGSYLRAWRVAEASPVRGGAGPFWSGSGRRWHDPDGIVSCGDAAGLVDPQTGEGIAAAIESGMQAGHHVAAFLHDGRDPRHLARYTDRVRDTYGRRYSMGTFRRTWSHLLGATAGVFTESPT